MAVLIAPAPPHGEQFNTGHVYLAKQLGRQVDRDAAGTPGQRLAGGWVWDGAGEGGGK